MKNKEIMKILEEYNLTRDQIQALEKFDRNQTVSFLNLISKNKIKYLDAAIIIIAKNNAITEKQLAILNKAPSDSIANVLAKFFADKKCDLSQANKISLAEGLSSGLFDNISFINSTNFTSYEFSLGNSFIFPSNIFFSISSSVLPSKGYFKYIN